MENKWCCLLLSAFSIGIQLSSSSQTGSRLREYCFDESFDASCDANEVIVMQSALYGRMELGRCITKLGDGCKTKDVLSILDKYCSGRRLCNINVADTRLLGTKPCSTLDYTAYLMAEYHCQPVHEKNHDRCTAYQQEPIPILDSKGFISSLYSAPNCKYSIEVSKGQQIIITVRDFEPYRNVSEKEGVSTICQQIILISEPSLETSDTICRNSDRERYRYTSQTHRVELSLKNTDTPYLIGYTVIGCPSVQAPTGSHVVQQSHDEAVIKCNHTQHTVKLQCKDGHWSSGGKIIKCSGFKKDHGNNHEKQEHNIGLPSLGISMLIIFGVALVIVIYVAGMIVCVMYVKRKRRVKERPVKAIQGDLQEDMMMPYDKIFTNPQEERLPMLLKSGSLRHHQQHPSQKCDCNEAHCQIHGPFSSYESPYIVAGPTYKLCQCDTGNQAVTSQTGTFSTSCCMSANSMPSNIDVDDTLVNNRNSTYQSSRSLKGVRFATINGNETKPFYLELNSRGLNNVARDNCPDVLPYDSNDKIEETQLSTFR